MSSGDRSNWNKSKNRGGFGGQRKNKEVVLDVADDEKVRARQERFNRVSSNNEYGLVSRGEEKTLQSNAELRREFFERIQREFIKHCSEFNVGGNNGKDIDWVLMSLRKLRESLLAIKPDDFSKRVFLYSVRISTKIGVYQTYLPSLNFLLEKCDGILTSSEFEECATYLILHISHFNNDNMKLFKTLNEKLPSSVVLRRVLVSWCTQDFLTWKSLRETLRSNLGYYKLMSFGEHRLLGQYLKDIGKSYFLFPRPDLESLCGRNWDDMKTEHNIPWKESEGTITIRERRLKTVKNV